MRVRAVFMRFDNFQRCLAAAQFPRHVSQGRGASGIAGQKAQTFV